MSDDGLGFLELGLRDMRTQTPQTPSTGTLAPNTPIPMTSLPTHEELAARLSMPELTFGIEFEVGLAVRRKIYDAWLENKNSEEKAAEEKRNGKEKEKEKETRSSPRTPRNQRGSRTATNPESPLRPSDSRSQPTSPLTRARSPTSPISARSPLLSPHSPESLQRSRNLRGNYNASAQPHEQLPPLPSVPEESSASPEVEQTPTSPLQHTPTTGHGFDRHGRARRLSETSDSILSAHGSIITIGQHPKLFPKLLNWHRSNLNDKLLQLAKSKGKLSSKIGTIIDDIPKAGADQYASWSLTYDTSLAPTRKRLAELFKEDLDWIKVRWRCVGGELVTGKTAYKEKLDWMDKFVELNTVLPPDTVKKDNEQNINYGAFFTKEEDEHLHIHFSLHDPDSKDNHDNGGDTPGTTPKTAKQPEGLTLDVVKNIIALYGLFEFEIMRWMRRQMRSNFYCRALRYGMQSTRLGKDEKNHGYPILIPGRVYTPREFTERVYACEDFTELIEEISGLSYPENLVSLENPDGTPRKDFRRQWYQWTSINISKARPNKPLTLEFRCHHGTLDLDEVKWWLLFLGELIKYSALCTKVDFKYRDDPREPLEEVKQTFLEKFLDESETSILDVLSFDPEGIEHFRKREKKYLNEDLDKEWALTQRVADEKLERQKQGRPSETGMFETTWYKDELKKLNKKPQYTTLGPQELPTTFQEIFDYLVKIAGEENSFGPDWKNKRWDQRVNDLEGRDFSQRVLLLYYMVLDYQEN